MDIKLIDHAHRDVIDHVVEILWVIVERRHWGKNHDAHAREFQHVLEMDFVEWRFTHNEDELSTFLENHVRRAMNQVVAQPMSNRCERAHTAWRDHHSERYERAAGDRSSLCADAVALRSQALYVLE